MYLDTDESPIITMRLHVIYCGELSGSALENYDAQVRKILFLRVNRNLVILL
jgi:hypothetical protein